MSTNLLASLVVAVLAFPAVADNQKDKPKPPSKATVDGNYSTLLRTITIPEDEQTYGKFNEFGYYAGTEHAGHKNLPQGYWVYVAPNWYIWKDSKKPAAQMQASWFQNQPIWLIYDPFTAMVGKDVRIRVRDKELVGKFLKNYTGYVLLEQKSSKTRILVNKAHIVYLQLSK